MSTASKTVANRLAVSRTVTASLTTHTEQLAAALLIVLFPDGPPEDFNLLVFLRALAGALERQTADVAQTDQNVAAERADDAGPRTRLEQTQQRLRSDAARTRDLLTSTYGPEVARRYGLQGATPNNPEQLLQHSRVASKLLREQPLTEAPLQPGIILDLPQLAATLEQDADEVAAALQTVRTESRELEQVLTARDRSLARWGNVYQGVATTATGLFRLAGLPELADRVRPTARRRAGLPEAEDLAEPTAVAGGNTGTE